MPEKTGNEDLSHFQKPIAVICMHITSADMITKQIG
jgi:hypothetical protein